jgi:hypothetical protein
MSRQLRLLLATAGLVVLLTLVLWAWRTRSLEWTNTLAVVLTLFVTYAGVTAPLLARRRHQHSTPQQLDMAVSALAASVHRQWAAEAEILALNPATLLPVRWSVLDGAPSQARAGLSTPARTGLTVRRKQVFLGRRVDALIKAYGRLASGRLLVVGDIGSGKTVVSILLTLGLLEARSRNDPVPVRLSLASWDVSNEHLDNWIRRRLAEDYPQLTNLDVYGRTITRGARAP